MRRHSLHLFSILGIEIRIHVSWLIIFFLITYILSASVFPTQYRNWPQHYYWLMGVATSLLFFMSVLLHELAHSLVARARGMKVRDIVLFVFGGVSEITEEPASAGTELVMAFVGPFTSFLLGVAFAFSYFLSRAFYEPVAAMALWLAQVNVLLAIFNLIPGFPLDGGRVLRSILWGISGNLESATRWATRMGMFVAYGLIFLGIWAIFTPSGFIAGLWLIFIGWFLNSAAQASYNNAVLKRLLTGYKVAEITARDCAYIPSDTPVDTIVHEHILGQGRRCLPVVEGGNIAGIITIHNIKAAPKERWEGMRASEVMVPLEKVRSIAPDADLWSALEEMTQEGVNQLAVMEEGRLIGMLGRDAVMSFIRTRAELGT